MKTHKLRNDEIRRSFVVTDMPLKTWLKFKDYCVDECGDVYWLAIDKLLTDKKMFQLLLKKEMEINVMQQPEPEEKEEEEVEVVKTLGGDIPLKKEE